MPSITLKTAIILFKDLPIEVIEYMYKNYMLIEERKIFANTL